MNTLNKICAALTIIFGVSLAVLMAEIVYVLLRGRRFRCRSFVTNNEDEESSLHTTTKTSKELFYFFCWKNQTTRIEPDHHAEPTESPAPESARPPPPSEAPVSELEEIMKRHALYGPARFLFTIKEEEREEMETDSSSMERCVSFEKTAVSLAPVVIQIDDDDDDDDDDDQTPPFCTPCGSPSFYTPSPSPPNGAITVL